MTIFKKNCVKLREKIATAHVAGHEVLGEAVSLVV